MTDKIRLAQKLLCAWYLEEPFVGVEIAERSPRERLDSLEQTARTLVTAELAAKAVPGYATDNEIEALIEPILIAVGLSLKHCFLYKPREEMRQAMRAALAPLQAQIATARDDAFREAEQLCENAFQHHMQFYSNGGSGTSLAWANQAESLKNQIRSLITTPAPENGNGPVP